MAEDGKRTDRETGRTYGQRKTKFHPKSNIYDEVSYSNVHINAVVSQDCVAIKQC